MKRIWMSDQTMRGLAESMPEGHRLCPVCNGAGELISGGRGPDYSTDECRRCKGHGTVRI